MWNGVRIGSRRAFTLIELLVVIAIIALLVSILLPALASAKRQGNVTLCLSRIRDVGSFATQYALDHDELLPRSLHSAGLGFSNGMPWMLLFYEQYFDEPWTPDYSPDLWLTLLNERYRCPLDPERVEPEAASTGRLVRVSYGLNVYYELQRGEWDTSALSDRTRLWGRMTTIPRPHATVLFGDVTTPGQEPDHLMAHFWTRFNAPPTVSEDRHEPRASYAYLDGHVMNQQFKRTFDRASDLDQWNPGTAR